MYLVTATEVAVKLAVIVFAGTVTLAGTCTVVSLLDNVTNAPPAGAGPLSVTVPVDEYPPRIGI